MGTYIAVQSQLTNLSEREVLVRPHFGHIEDVPLVALGLFRLHHLHEDFVDGVVSAVDGLVHVLDEVVRVLAGQLGGLLSGEVLDANGGFDVEFDVFERAILDQVRTIYGARYR